MFAKNEYWLSVITESNRASCLIEENSTAEVGLKRVCKLPFVILPRALSSALKLLRHLAILFNGPPKPEACWSSRS